MKPLNSKELANYVEWIRPQLTGAQLQDVHTDGELLILELYGRGESHLENQKGTTFQLLIDLRPVQPFLILLLGQKKLAIKKSSKPVALFLASHGENLFVDELSAQPEKGRVVQLGLRNQTRRCAVEIILVPHAVNVIVTTKDKTISWNKPKSLPGGHSQDLAAADFDWSKLADDYLQWRWSPQKKGGGSSRDQDRQSLARGIEKKKMALTKIQASVDPQEEARWRAFGDHLKMASTADEFADLWDRKLNVRDNRERAFKKAKDLALKRSGSDARVQILRQEIVDLEKKLIAFDQGGVIDSEENVGPQIGSQILKKTNSKGRSRHLKSGAQAVIGKSAKDNLALLRQARSWDFWIHLKDEPSAHAIIFRNKNQSISREEIAEVAQWVLQQSSSKKVRLEGTKMDVVVVECRFVRPIKGDRLGRVTYHSPTVHSIAFSR